jgi:hypothetical protein
MSDTLKEYFCTSCGARYVQMPFVCARCGTILFDPKASTIHLRIDPNFLRLRRRETGEINGPTSAQIVALQIRGVTQRLYFEEGTALTLGRVDLANPDMSRFDLTAFGGHERGVSREHCVLRYEEGQLTITDLGSSNGTQVNRERLAANQPHKLRDGDELTLGSLMLIVRFEAAPTFEDTAQAGDNSQ